jgi:hypothetical protein
MSEPYYQTYGPSDQFRAFQAECAMKRAMGPQQARQEFYNPAQYLVQGVDSQVDNSQRTGGEVGVVIICALFALVVVGIAKLVQLGVRAGVRAYKTHQAAKAVGFDKRR